MTVSVVMATYNGQDHVEQQVRSILDGTRPPDELIVVDDHSSDGTMAVLERLREFYRDHTVKLIANESNIGATKSFFLGAKQTSGDLVFFSDQDDIWLPNKVETMLAVTSTTEKISMVYTDGHITDEDLHKTGRSIFSTRRKADLSLGSKRSAIDVAVDPDIKGCTMAVSGNLLRELVDRTGSEIGKFWGHDHWVALIAYGLGEVRAINKPLILHRFHRRNVSSGVKLNPFSPKHWRKWLLAVAAQDPDHLSKRYLLAIETAQSYGSRFSSESLDALKAILTISKAREKLRALSFPRKFISAFRMWLDGTYGQHYNGIFTFMRDVFM